MYKKFDPQPPQFGRFHIGDELSSLTDPIHKGDTVTIRASEDIKFHIRVEDTLAGKIQGVIGGITSTTQGDIHTDEVWSIEDKIEIPERFITAVSHSRRS